MTRKEWDAKWHERFSALRKADPTGDLAKIQARALKQTTKEYGPRPEGVKSALLRFLWQYVKTGGNVDFKWSKNLWKALKAALISALSVAAVAGVGVLLQPIDTSEELVGLGIPGWAIPLIVALVASIRNYLKITAASRRAPQQ